MSAFEMKFIHLLGFYFADASADICHQHRKRLKSVKHSSSKSCFYNKSIIPQTCCNVNKFLNFFGNRVKFAHDQQKNEENIASRGDVFFLYYIYACISRDIHVREAPQGQRLGCCR